MRNKTQAEEFAKSKNDSLKDASEKFQTKQQKSKRQEELNKDIETLDKIISRQIKALTVKDSQQEERAKQLRDLLF